MRAGGGTDGGARGAYQVEGEAGRRRAGVASGAQPRRGRNRSWGGGSRPCPSTARTASSCTPARGREEGPTHPGSRLCPSPSYPPAWLLNAADDDTACYSRDGGREGEPQTTNATKGNGRTTGKAGRPIGGPWELSSPASCKLKPWRASVEVESSSSLSVGSAVSQGRLDA